MFSSLRQRLVPYLLALLLLGGVAWLFFFQEGEPGPKDEIRRVVRLALTTDRAQDCKKLYTRRFLEQTTRERGAAALRECIRKADGDADAKGVAVRRLRIHGLNARADLRLLGAEMDGTKLTLLLVEDVLGWKIDRLAAVDVDLAAFRRAQIASAAKEGIPVEEARCMVRRITTVLGERGIERAAVTGAERIGRMGVGCVSTATIRRAFAKSLAKQHLPPPLAKCILDTAVDGRSTAELRAMLSAPTARQRAWGRDAAVGCARALGMAPASA